MKVLSYLVLNKEARLFDTKEFIIKTFVAVLLGSFVGRWVPYVSKDMISLLFGMILTIEPVNMTGIRSGLKQVEATIIGAMITGIILILFRGQSMSGEFTGYLPWAVALAVTATLYVSLLIDWRNFSVVAVFTAIYMTQYVQIDELGNPSEIETFKLRMAALLTGVLIAFLVNFVFSVFGYRHMLEKRIYHLLNDLRGKMNATLKMLEEDKFEEATGIMRSYPGLFGNLDWIYGTIVDFKKDPLVKRSEGKQVKLEKILKMTALIREMAHVNYDVCYRITKGDHHYKDDEFQIKYERLVGRIELLEDKLDQIIHNKKPGDVVEVERHETEEVVVNEIHENLTLLDGLLSHYL